MTHYFNTEEQKNVDKALEDGDYQQALYFYEKALQDLNVCAEPLLSEPDVGYYDKKAHVLCDMVITRCWYMSSCLDNNGFNRDIQNQWNKVRQLLKLIDNIQPCISYITAEKIKYMHATIVKTCEYISDMIMDDDVYNPELETFLLIDQIKHSRVWLGKTINYKFKSGEEIDIEMHLAYLNLFQREYELASSDKSKYKILIIFTSYIDANAKKLLNLDLDWSDKLTLMKYQLFVAVENKNQDVLIIAGQCQQLIDAYIDGIKELEQEKDKALIMEVKGLIKTVTHESKNPLDTYSLDRLSLVSNTSGSKRLRLIDEEPHTGCSPTQRIKQYHLRSCSVFAPVATTQQDKVDKNASVKFLGVSARS